MSGWSCRGCHGGTPFAAAECGDIRDAKSIDRAVLAGPAARGGRCVDRDRPRSAPRASRTCRASAQVMEASLEVDRIPGFLPSDVERAIVRIEPDPDGHRGRARGRRRRRLLHAEPRRPDRPARRIVDAATADGSSRPPRTSCGSAATSVLQLYVPPTCPSSVAFARATGFVHRSSLWQFQLAARPGRHRPAPGVPRRTSSSAPGTTRAIPTSTPGRRSCSPRSRATRRRCTGRRRSSATSTTLPGSIRAACCSSPRPPPRSASSRSAGSRSPIREQPVGASGPATSGSSACCPRGAGAGSAASCCAGA